MTKAQIITQFRVWAKENDAASEVTDDQIYAYIDAGMALWIAKVIEARGMAGFYDYTEETPAVTQGVSADLAAVPIDIIEAFIGYASGDYRKMERAEGGYEKGDDHQLNASWPRPRFRLLAKHIEVAPMSSGIAKVRYIEEQDAFTSADTANPTPMVSLAENGLAAYCAGIFWENQDNGQLNAQRAYAAAQAFLDQIPVGFRTQTY